MAPTPRQVTAVYNVGIFKFPRQQEHYLRPVLLPLCCSFTRCFHDRIFYVLATPVCVTRPAETIFTHSFTYCSYQWTICIKTNYIILHFLRVRTKSSKMARALKQTVQHKPHTGTRSRGRARTVWMKASLQYCNPATKQRRRWQSQSVVFISSPGLFLRSSDTWGSTKIGQFNPQRPPTSGYAIPQHRYAAALTCHSIIVGRPNTTVLCYFSVEKLM